MRDLIEKVNEFREEVYNRSRNDATRDSIMQLTDFMKEIIQRLGKIEEEVESDGDQGKGRSEIS